jgi:hypothetical protein
MLSRLRELASEVKMSEVGSAVGLPAAGDLAKSVTLLVSSAR